MRMKKVLLSCLFAWAALGAAQAQSPASAAGKYCGELYISLYVPVDDSTEPMANQTVDLAAGEADGTIDFALYNFSFGMTLGDIQLPGVGLSFEGETGTFAENPARFFSFLDGGIKATAFLNPATSLLQGDSLTANIDVVWTNLKGDDTTEEDYVPIYVLFKGKKLAPVDFAPIAGTYSGTLSIYDEEGQTLLEERKEQDLIFSGNGTNDANFSFGNLILNDTEWKDVAFTPAVYTDEAGNVAFLPSETIYNYASVSGDEEAQAMLSGTCSLNEEGLALSFLMACGETIYTCVYDAKLAVPAGVHTISTAHKDQTVYSLSGIRVANTANGRLPKGIYIINGKKQIVK